MPILAARPQSPSRFGRRRALRAQGFCRVPALLKRWRSFSSVATLLFLLADPARADGWVGLETALVDDLGRVCKAELSWSIKNK
jgi:hypothetical protein